MTDEICTTDILRAALSANKECFIPHYIGSVMDMVKLRSWEDFMGLPETSWKIKQPADDDSSRESAFDAGSLHTVSQKTCALYVVYSLTISWTS